MTTNIHRAVTLGYIDGDLDVIARRAADGIRARTGRMCMVWVNAQGLVILVPADSPDAPDFGDDIAPMVGMYLRKPGETFWRDRLREALIEQARGMKVAA